MIHLIISAVFRCIIELPVREEFHYIRIKVMVKIDAIDTATSQPIGLLNIPAHSMEIIQREWAELVAAYGQ